MQLELPLGLADEQRRPGSERGMARWTADRAVDAIRDRFGWEAVGYGSVALGSSRSVPDAFRELPKNPPPNAAEDPVGGGGLHSGHPFLSPLGPPPPPRNRIAGMEGFDKRDRPPSRGGGRAAADAGARAIAFEKEFPARRCGDHLGRRLPDRRVAVAAEARHP